MYESELGHMGMTENRKYEWEQAPDSVRKRIMELLRRENLEPLSLHLHRANKKALSVMRGLYLSSILFLCFFKDEKFHHKKTCSKR